MSYDRDTMLVCGAFAGETDLLKIAGFKVLDTGVGNLASALALQEYLFKHPGINSVVFCGSGGFYHDRFITGDFVYSNRFWSINPAAISGIIKIPELMTNFVETKPVEQISSALSGITRGETNSFSGITIEDPDRTALDRLKDIDFENMETFGLAMVCNSHNIHFTAIYCLTNKVGRNGSTEWKSSWKKCSASLQNFLISALSGKTAT